MKPREAPLLMLTAPMAVLQSQQQSLSPKALVVSPSWTLRTRVSETKQVIEWGEPAPVAIKSP